jgi:Protein of unknown function (DUF3489)
MKLSDTQLIILSSASQRTDHAAVLPANLKGSAASKVVNKLLNEKLLQELRAKDDMPVWRRGDDNRPYSLRITKAGLKAIEVEDVAEASDNIAAANPAGVAVPDVSTAAKSSERPSRTKRSGAKKTAAVSGRAVKASSDRTKPDSKQDRIVALLRRPEGANLDVLVKETGWQKHSVRGFLAGTVRKKLKLPLLSEKIDGVRNYRIGTAKAAKTTRTAAARKA